MEHYFELSLPTGQYLYLGSDTEVLGLWRRDARHSPPFTPEKEQAHPPALFVQTREWLRAYFADERPQDTLPLAPRGSTFGQSVWRLLREIPYGQTVTYGMLAQKLGSSARAVGGAVGRNPISILIPCHRVVGSMHRLTGYAGGLDTKLALLRHEGADWQ